MEVFHPEKNVFLVDIPGNPVDFGGWSLVPQLGPGPSWSVVPLISQDL